MLAKIDAFFSGRKTYIVAGLLALVALIDVLTGDMTVSELVEDPNLVILLNGLAFAALRAAK